MQHRTLDGSEQAVKRTRKPKQKFKRINWTERGNSGGIGLLRKDEEQPKKIA